MRKALLLGAALVCVPLPAFAQGTGSGQAQQEEANRLNDGALEFLRQGRFSEAAQGFRGALALEERLFGPADPNVGKASASLAIALIELGQLRAAEQAARRAVSIHEGSLQPNDPALARSLGVLSTYLWTDGRYVAAADTQRRALQILEKVAPRQAQTGEALDALAERLQSLSDLRNARDASTRALAILNGAAGPDDLRSAHALITDAKVSASLGEFSRAVTSYRQGLAVYEKKLGPDHPRVASALVGLGWALHESGDTASAEVALRRAVHIRETKLGTTHYLTGESLGYLGGLLADKHDSSASAMLARALMVQQDALGNGHPALAFALSRYAMLSQADGKPQEAEPLFRGAVQIKESEFGPDHVAVTGERENLAAFLMASGKNGEAEQLFARVLAIRERALGPNHPEVARALGNVAQIAYAKQDYAGAERLAKRALSIQESALGADTPRTAETRLHVAQLAAAQGRYPEAVGIAERAASAQDQGFVRLAVLGSDREKAAYFRSLESSTFFVLSLDGALKGRDESATRLAFTEWLRRKGRILDASADTLATTRDSVRAEDTELVKRLTTLRSELATRTLAGPLERQTPVEHGMMLEEIRREVAQVEAKLGEREGGAGKDTIITLESVRSALPANSALIDFALYRPLDPRVPSGGAAELRYVAYVLAPKGPPRSVDLGPAAAIDELVSLTRKLLSSRSAEYGAAARRLDALTMGKLRDLLGEARQVYVSPDGMLNLVPFAALEDELNEALLLRYSFTYLASGRDLLRFGHGGRKGHGAVIVANPDYGIAAAKRAGAFQPNAQPLPGTAIEGADVARLLAGARLISAADATEGALKTAVRPAILHVATHGYFLADRPKLAAGTRALNFEVDSSGPASEPAQSLDPMLRAGLVLANANSGTSGNDDGILTALEASMLDLHGTSLVVLSACETGVGEVHNGDGVYGLRRAFALAGADAEIMSLWKVSDDATKDLMVNLYRNLAKGEGRSEALRKAQLSLYAKEPSAHPFYWAAFIFSGDPGPLPSGAVDFQSGADSKATGSVPRVDPSSRGCGCRVAGAPESDTPLGLALSFAGLAGLRLLKRRRLLALAPIALLASLLVSAPARAQAPHLETLPASGMSVEVPDGWAANLKPLVAAPGLPPMDQIARLEPPKPGLQVTLMIERGTDCFHWEGSVGKLGDAGTRPDFVPGTGSCTLRECTGWDEKVFQKKSNGNLQLHACYKAPEGIVWAMIYVEGTKLNAKDAKGLRATLAALQKAADAAMPLTQNWNIGVSGAVRIGTLNGDVKLPQNWKKAPFASQAGGDAPFDMLMRETPADPELSLTLLNPAKMSLGSSCSAWEAQQRAGKGAWLRNGAPYLPPSWYQVVEQDPPDAKGVSNVTACLQAASGPVLAMVRYSGSPSDADFQDVRPMLEAIAAYAPNSVPAPAPAPVTSPPPPASAAPPPAENTNYTSEPVYQPYTPPPSAPAGSPVNDEGKKDSAASTSELPDLLGSLPEFSLFNVTANDETLGSQIGATVGIGVLFLGKDSVNFAMQEQFRIGFTSQKNIPFDGGMALGVSFRSSKLALVPLVGFGGDTMGAGEDASFRLPGAFYWQVRGLLLAELGSWGVSLAGARLNRGSISGDPDTIPNETRLEGRLYNDIGEASRLSFGIEYTNFSDARLLGAIIGWSAR